MKKQLFLLLAFVAVMCTASAYDFSAVAPSGQTLYYNISGRNVTVTSQKSSGPPYYQFYPTGNLIIPDTVTFIGTNYPVTAIGQHAFFGCNGLTSITIPNSVTTIDDMAFSGCHSLQTITISHYVTSIGIGAFSNCRRLSSITVDSGNTVYDSRNNSNAIIERATNTLIAGCMSTVIPNSVTSIGMSAFEGSGLTSLTIPNSVTSIDAWAFYRCDSLTSVTIGESVESIGDYAFYWCDQLASIVCKGSTPPTLGSTSSVQTTATVTIPCGTTNAYTASWGSRYTFLEAFLYELNIATSDSTQGTVSVQQQPSCSDSVAILIATPATGYRFDHWSNGSTDNPYTLTVTSDTTLVAYFAIVGGGTDGISDIKNNDVSVYVAEGRIHVTIAGQTSDEFSVYDVMGRRTAHVIASDKSPVLPAGVYIVKVGTLPARKVVVIR